MHVLKADCLHRLLLDCLSSCVSYLNLCGTAHWVRPSLDRGRPPHEFKGVLSAEQLFWLIHYGDCFVVVLIVAARALSATSFTSNCRMSLHNISSLLLNKHACTGNTAMCGSPALRSDVSNLSDSWEYKHVQKHMFKRLPCCCTVIGLI